MVNLGLLPIFLAAFLVIILAIGRMIMMVMMMMFSLVANAMHVIECTLKIFNPIATGNLPGWKGKRQ